MSHDNQRIKNKATARKLAGDLKRHALAETEELAGLVAIEHFTPHSEADSEQCFDAFVVAALTQLTRRIGELEKQLETLREQTGANEFDEGLRSGPPSENGMAG